VSPHSLRRRIRGTGANARKTALGSRSEKHIPPLWPRARQAAGARIARKIEPDGAYTTDLRADRLNLEVDWADVVRRAWCG
jgi:hypothetical protein